MGNQKVTGRSVVAVTTALSLAVTPGLATGLGNDRPARARQRLAHQRSESYTRLWQLQARRVLARGGRQLSFRRR